MERNGTSTVQDLNDIQTKSPMVVPYESCADCERAARGDGITPTYILDGTAGVESFCGHCQSCSIINSTNHGSAVIPVARHDIKMFLEICYQYDAAGNRPISQQRLYFHMYSYRAYVYQLYQIQNQHPYARIWVRFHFGYDMTDITHDLKSCITTVSGTARCQCNELRSYDHTEMSWTNDIRSKSHPLYVYDDNMSACQDMVAANEMKQHTHDEWHALGLYEPSQWYNVPSGYQHEQNMNAYVLLRFYGHAFVTHMYGASPDSFCSERIEQMESKFNTRSYMLVFCYPPHDRKRAAQTAKQNLEQFQERMKIEHKKCVDDAFREMNGAHDISTCALLCKRLDQVKQDNDPIATIVTTDVIPSILAFMGAETKVNQNTALVRAISSRLVSSTSLSPTHSERPASLKRKRTDSASVCNV